LRRDSSSHPEIVALKIAVVVKVVAVMEAAMVKIAMR
jgi:hypothetical protein